MQQWTARAGEGLDGLALTTVDPPEPGPGEVRVRLRAASLNARDHQVMVGEYRVAAPEQFVPLSDGAGDVTAVGSGVDDFGVGDRVVTVANSSHIYGDFHWTMIPGMLGISTDGVLREEFVIRTSGLTRLPDSMSYVDAACVPCTGVTAWNAVVETGAVGPGDWVAILGTGGVSMWALSIAKAAGARVVVTSSSDDKLRRASTLGADATVNYRTNPDWDIELREISAGEGVDLVVETGGPATYSHSISATRMFGRVAVVAVVGSPAPERDMPIADAMRRMVNLSPIGLGSRQMQERLIQAMDGGAIRPEVGAVIPFADAVTAYELARDGGDHLGKVVIAV